MTAVKTLSGILGVPQAERLQANIYRKAASPTLDRLDDPERALRFIRTNLRGSYLFGRILVPSYGSSVLAALTGLPPADDKLGVLISLILEVVKGEIANSNVFDRPGECHSHYYDAREAYEAAGGNMEEVSTFERLTQQAGIHCGLELSPLWSPGSKAYAYAMIECSKNPLATFILMCANEELAPKVYRRVLASLSRLPRFDKFRHFIERHVQFDETGHGPVTLEWLDYFLAHAQVTPNVRAATDLVLRAYN